MYEASSLLETKQTDAAGQFNPLVIVQKQNKLTEDQVNAMLGGILKAMKMKWVTFGLLLGLGLLVLIGGIFLCIKSRQHASAGGNLKLPASGDKGGGTEVLVNVPDSSDKQVNLSKDHASQALMADE